VRAARPRVCLCGAAARARLSPKEKLFHVNNTIIPTIVSAGRGFRE